MELDRARKLVVPRRAGGHRRSARCLPVLLAIALGIGGAAGCAHTPGVYGSPGASPMPGTPWTPPAKAAEKQTKEVAAASAEARKGPPLIPPDLMRNVQNLGLADIVDIALRNSNVTHLAWAQARAAAAAYGSRRAAWLPTIGGSAEATWQKTAPSGGRPSSTTRSYTVGGDLSWLLFNFGGREASIEETREALFAADWAHNAAIQNVILEVEQAYYNYFAAKSLLAAQQATVNEAQTSLNAANDRHTAGIATIADVLQAQTALSQAQLALDTLQGQIQTTRGLLATAMGLPANTTYDVELPIGAPPVEETKMSVDEYLETALKERPDLAAARAQALEARAHLGAVRAEGYPAITAEGSLGRYYLSRLTGGIETYNASVGVSVPLFTGFSHTYDVLEAKAQLDAARAAAKNEQDLVTLQVWTSYYDLQTATQRVRTSDDLINSATQNQDVAAGRYRAGVGSILDLLTAQAALESARSQQIQARADWWLAVAQLAHDTGTLDLSTVAGAKGGKP